MRVKRMGRTGLKVSEVCMGTMTFGSQADERAAHAILDRALDAGGYNSISIRRRTFRWA